MTASSLFLALLGLVLSFLPAEILSAFDVQAKPMATIALQVMGALYLGFAFLNWMARRTVIGGIYNKPLALGNFMHFTLGSFALLKAFMHIDGQAVILLPLTLSYVIFAVLFGYVFQTNPS